jgi:hypothetical protein
MERGYLVAVLAIIVTFTGLSRGIRSLEQGVLAHFQHLGALARDECSANSAARAIAKLKVKTRLVPHTPEEAQLLAEMNVPSGISEEMAAQQDAAAGTRCARARAMQEMQRAQRDMLRMQRDMRTSREVRLEPLSIQVHLPPDFEQRIQERTEEAARRATEHVRVKIESLRVSTATSTGFEQ